MDRIGEIWYKVKDKIINMSNQPPSNQDSEQDNPDKVNTYLDFLQGLRDRVSPVVFYAFLAMQAILFGGIDDTEAKALEAFNNQAVVGQEFCSLNSKLRLTPNNDDDSNLIRVLTNQLVQIVDGNPTQYDGYNWFRVQLPGTDTFGYVAFETLSRASSCPTTQAVTESPVQEQEAVVIYIDEVVNIFHPVREGTLNGIPHDHYNAHHVLFVVPKRFDNYNLTNMTNQFIIFSPNIETFSDVPSVTYRNLVVFHLPSNVTGFSVCRTSEAGQNGHRLPSAVYVDQFLQAASDAFGSAPIFVSSMNGRIEDPGSGTFAVSLTCEQ